MAAALNLPRRHPRSLLIRDPVRHQPSGRRSNSLDCMVSSPKTTRSHTPIGSDGREIICAARRRLFRRSGAVFVVRHAIPWNSNTLRDDDAGPNWWQSRRRSNAASLRSTPACEFALEEQKTLKENGARWVLFKVLNGKFPEGKFGAVEWIRTTTVFLPPAPQAGASANSATTAPCCKLTLRTKSAKLCHRTPDFLNRERKVRYFFGAGFCAGAGCC